MKASWCLIHWKLKGFFPTILEDYSCNPVCTAEWNCSTFSSYYAFESPMKFALTKTCLWGLLCFRRAKKKCFPIIQDHGHPCLLFVPSSQPISVSKYCKFDLNVPWTMWVNETVSLSGFIAARMVAERNILHLPPCTNSPQMGCSH